MKKYILFIILSVSLVMLSSCSSIKGVFGKNATAESKSRGKVEQVQKSLNQNAASKMEEVSILASGTDYALNKVTNKEPSVVVAQDINNRVISLSGKPNLNAEKEMWKTVDQLLSEVASERAKGAKSMSQRDTEIATLQQENKVLLNAKDVEIDKYMKLASATAMKVDTLQSSLDDYKGWWGLSAVGKGLWQFVTTISWWMLGGSVLFLILRLASTTNPLAASIFSIFNRMGSWVVNTISIIFPKALEMAGNISKKIYDESSLILRKIIDNIQSIKELEKKTGKDITLKELLIELDKSLDKPEKDIIDKIKKELGY